jgi:hypothetical protein
MEGLTSTMLGSATAGVVARVFCHPLDTCKSRLQVGDQPARQCGGPSRFLSAPGANAVGGAEFFGVPEHV